MDTKINKKPESLSPKIIAYLEQFPDNRLSGDTSLRQSQLVMLRLLKVFDSICQKHNFTYWLDAGTLLGAVRHGGFIPWDDDLDVMMPYNDYQKFLALPTTEIPFDVFLQTENTDVDYICPWVKLRDRFSHIDESTGPYPYSQSIFMDIFPVIMATENQHKSRKWFHYLSPYNAKPERIVKHHSLKSKCRIIAERFFVYPLILLTKIPFTEKKLQKYVNTGNKAWEYLPPIRPDDRIENSLIFPLSKIKFEDSEFWAPCNAHAYLSQCFGDYMTPPPEEKRVSVHSVTAMYPIGPNPHFSALTWSDYH